MFGTLSLAMGDKPASFIGQPYEFQQGNRTRHSACDRCRSAKVKCNSERPKCERCTSLAKTCNYTKTRKPRQSQAQSRANRAPRDYIVFEGPPISSSSSSGSSSRRRSEVSSNTKGSSTGASSSASSQSRTTPPSPTSTSISTSTRISTPASQPRDIDPPSAADTLNAANSALWYGYDLGQSPSTDEFDIYLSGFLSSSVADDGDSVACAQSSPPWSMSALTTENDFCLDEPAIHLHHHTSLLESVSGTGSGSGSGSGPSKTSPDSTATHFQLNNHSNTTRGHYPADGECNCLKQLTSSLFNLNNWSQSGGGGGGVSAPSSTAAAAAQGLSFMSWMDFDTFLVLHKDSMEKWDGVKDCRSACFLRREYAVLLIMNVEQLATLQLDLVAVITSANADNGENDGAGGDDSLRAAAASRRGSKTGSGGSGGSGGSSSRRSRKSSPLPSSVAPSPFSSSASSKRPMSIGKFVIDDASDEAMIVMQLLGARISHLTSFVKSLRPRLVQAGLDECCTKLDAAMVALGKASRHIKSR